MHITVAWSQAASVPPWAACLAMHAQPLDSGGLACRCAQSCRPPRKIGSQFILSSRKSKFTIWPQEVANFFVSEARRNFHAPASQVRWSTVLRCTCAMSCCAAQRRLTGASSWEVQLSAALMPAT